MLYDSETWPSKDFNRSECAEKYMMRFMYIAAVRYSQTSN